MNDLRVKRLALLASHPFCHWCGRRLTVDSSTLEHLRPRAHGGGNRFENLALACASCNNFRGDELCQVKSRERIALKRAELARQLRKHREWKAFKAGQRRNCSANFNLTIVFRPDGRVLETVCW